MMMIREGKVRWWVALSRSLSELSCKIEERGKRIGKGAREGEEEEEVRVTTRKSIQILFVIIDESLFHIILYLNSLSTWIERGKKEQEAAKGKEMEKKVGFGS